MMLMILSMFVHGVCLSLRVPKSKNLTDAEVDEAFEAGKWACEELNLGPHAYQACALTT